MADGLSSCPLLYTGVFNPPFFPPVFKGCRIYTRTMVNQSFSTVFYGSVCQHEKDWHFPSNVWLVLFISNQCHNLVHQSGLHLFNYLRKQTEGQMYVFAEIGQFDLVKIKFKRKNCVSVLDR